MAKSEAFRALPRLPALTGQPRTRLPFMQCNRPAITDGDIPELGGVSAILILLSVARVAGVTSDQSRLGNPCAEVQDSAFF